MSMKNGQAYSAAQDIRAMRLKILREILDNIKPDNGIPDDVVLQGGTKTINKIVGDYMDMLKKFETLLTPDFIKGNNILDTQRR